MPQRARQPNACQQQTAPRRAQILETALNSFAEQGFTATSTRQITREAGVNEDLIAHPGKGAVRWLPLAQTATTEQCSRC